MAYQAMLGTSTASALPLGGVQTYAAEYQSSVPSPSPAPTSGYPPGIDPAFIARNCIILTISFFLFLFSYLCLLLCPFLPFSSISSPGTRGLSMKVATPTSISTFSPCCPTCWPSSKILMPLALTLSLSASDVPGPPRLP